ncbi:uncharacterized protein B0H18DRAFT_975025 [Fomitopsis serialis]|uniref:uncharacterized protein n=1 Tax=Fomitopsis serialis TaxID=139415 RepID=UPI002008240B|nr:uncharacterized protein B0H18DRAFT_975025 [Neoantrodia serialis]KAH9936680.1 hypothetical protein B0H18DRAFT_975025 [Neoantrodia serialis]
MAAEPSGPRARVALSALQTREAVEKKIAYQSGYLTELKTHLNTFAPISVLPPEVLCKVFLHAADSAISARVPSHVCKHWRDAALSCAALWSSITVSTQRASKWLAEVLERSKCAPLTVTINVRYAESQAYHLDFSLVGSLAMVLSQISRIRFLSITIEDAHLDQVLRLLSGPAPLLESLLVRSSKQTTFRSHVRFNGGHAQQQLLQHLEATNLQRLELGSVSLQWDGLGLYRLTHLTLNCIPYTHTTLGDIDDLLSAIVHMVHLEELTIEREQTLRFSRVVPEVPIIASPVAALPHLRVLRISESAVNGVCLLDHLYTPSLSYLDFEYLDFEMDDDAELLYPPLVAAVAAKAPSLGTFRTLSIIAGSLEGDYVRVEAYHDVHGAADIERFNGDLRKIQRPALVVSISSVQSDRVPDLGRLLPIDDVHSLFVSGSLFPEDAWLPLLQRTTNVTELFAMDGSESSFFPEALLHRCCRERRNGDSDSDDEGHHYRCILPQLRTLTLSHFWFVTRGYHGQPDQQGQPFVGRLLDCFIQRYECGAEIEQLRIIHPVNLKSRDIDLLEEVVRAVVWDGSLYENGVSVVETSYTSSPQWNYEAEEDIYSEFGGYGEFDYY